jgi:hypothetical protein
MTVSLKDLRFGIEIETIRLSRRNAVVAIARALKDEHDLDCTTTPRGGFYDKQVCRLPDGREWVAMSDGSLSCGTHAEVVSPICTYADLPIIQTICRALRRAGAKVDASCGIHIHIDGAPFKADPKAIVRLAKWHNKQENIVFAMLGTRASRVNQWTRPINQGFYSRIEKYRGANLNTIQRYWYEGNGSYRGPSAHYDNSRYHALNLHSLFFRGTVEFRHFEATLHAGKVKAFIQFAAACAAYALNGKSAKGTKREFVAYRGKWDARILLRNLLLVGDEFKTCRLHLMDHLQGSSANCPKDPNAR